MRSSNFRHILRHAFRRSLIPAALGSLAAATFLPAPATAQRADGGFIAGNVAGAATHSPVPDVLVALEPGARNTRTGDMGRFVVGPLAPGDYELRLVRIGYEPRTVAVTVAESDTSRVRITLDPVPARLSAVEVRAGVLSPDLTPPTRVRQQEVREENPHDLGQVMRGVPGVDAVRRGPVGLDPSVRGLRETEVGVYIDGTRMFPGGPARMDSPLSHLDPSTIRTMEIVKGPYALTWGAGNLTAIRVRTQELPPARQGLMHGTLTTGYTGNSDEAEGLGSVYGTAGSVSYLASGAWRRGYDYTSGDGSTVPADFRSTEGRGKLGYALPDGSYLTLSGGYQDQQGVDNPGNLLNAKFFHTYTAAAEWKRERASGTARSIDVVAYTNHVSHHMTNDGKPTAYPDSTRMPPFPLDVGVAAKVRVSGGRLDLGLAPHGPWSFEVGGDTYVANRDATRTIRRRDTGMLMFTDLMWPDATITDGGVFARASRAIGDRFSFAATGRLDLVRSHADTASDFFLANTSAKLTSTETNVSGAATLRAELSDRWTSTIGIGSAVRTADATERYSDRVPASKAQTSAEFMGDPGLAPERNTQLDLWLEAHYPRFSLEVNPFVRWVNDYITLEPTDLPKRLPLSPATVYRYVNGDAHYWGAEASLGYTLASPLLARVGVTYLRGENTSLSEPSLGVAPLEGTVGLRFEPGSGRGYLDGSVRMVGAQDRVATLLGETSTDGHVTADLRAGLNILPGVELRAGVLNIGDVQYVDHLNHKNPYSGMVIPEAGRELFANLTYAF